MHYIQNIEIVSFLCTIFTFFPQKLGMVHIFLLRDALNLCGKKCTNVLSELLKPLMPDLHRVCMNTYVYAKVQLVLMSKKITNEINLSL